MTQIGPGMVQQSQSQCAPCGGRGEKVEAGAECKECRGKRTVRSR